MKTRKLAALLSLVVALVALSASTALADVDASAAGNIGDNTIESATIDPKTGNTTLSGTLTCSTPTTVTVYGWARQSRGNSDHFAQYFGGTEVTCGATPTAYDVTLLSGYESDKLIPGRASVGTWATYCASGTCPGLGADGEMWLHPAP